ncbi:MAG: hypothetical protein Q9162_002932 [Coniocarpon cinnabarinum]
MAPLGTKRPREEDNTPTDAQTNDNASPGQAPLAPPASKKARTMSSKIKTIKAALSQDLKLPPASKVTAQGFDLSWPPAQASAPRASSSNLSTPAANHQEDGSKEEGEDYDPNQVPTFEKARPLAPAPKARKASKVEEAPEASSKAGYKLRKSTIAKEPQPAPRPQRPATPPPASKPTRRARKARSNVVERSEVVQKALATSLEESLTSQCEIKVTLDALAQVEVDLKRFRRVRPFARPRSGNYHQDREYNATMKAALKTALKKGTPLDKILDQLHAIDKDFVEACKPRPRAYPEKPKGPAKDPANPYAQRREPRGDRKSAPYFKHEAALDAHAMKNTVSSPLADPPSAQLNENLREPVCNPGRLPQPAGLAGENQYHSRSIPHWMRARVYNPPHFNSHLDQFLWEAANGTIWAPQPPPRTETQTWFREYQKECLDYWREVRLDRADQEWYQCPPREKTPTEHLRAVQRDYLKRGLTIDGRNPEKMGALRAAAMKAQGRKRVPGNEAEDDAVSLKRAKTVQSATADAPAVTTTTSLPEPAPASQQASNTPGTDALDDDLAPPRPSASEVTKRQKGQSDYKTAQEKRVNDKNAQDARGDRQGTPKRPWGTHPVSWLEFHAAKTQYLEEQIALRQQAQA